MEGLREPTELAGMGLDHGVLHNPDLPLHSASLADGRENCMTYRSQEGCTIALVHVKHGNGGSCAVHLEDASV
jgi:hypothetical protein